MRLGVIYKSICVIWHPRHRVSLGYIGGAILSVWRYHYYILNWRLHFEHRTDAGKTDLGFYLASLSLGLFANFKELFIIIKYIIKQQTHSLGNCTQL